MSDFFKEMNDKRVKALDSHIKDCSTLINDYQEIFDMSSDPKEKMRCEHSIKRYTESLEKYTKERLELLK